jgi:hypothetical protein
VIEWVLTNVSITSFSGSQQGKDVFTLHFDSVKIFGATGGPTKGGTGNPLPTFSIAQAKPV